MTSPPAHPTSTRPPMSRPSNGMGHRPQGRLPAGVGRPHAGGHDRRVLGGDPTPGWRGRRGPRRWYVEVHPQDIDGFVDLVTHPWVVAMSEAVLGSDYQIVEIGFDVPFQGAQPAVAPGFPSPPDTYEGRRITSLAFNLTGVDVTQDMGPFGSPRARNTTTAARGSTRCSGQGPVAAVRRACRAQVPGARRRLVSLGAHHPPRDAARFADRAASPRPGCGPAWCRPCRAPRPDGDAGLLRRPPAAGA